MLLSHLSTKQRHVYLFETKYITRSMKELRFSQQFKGAQVPRKNNGWNQGYLNCNHKQCNQNQKTCTKILCMCYLDRLIYWGLWIRGENTSNFNHKRRERLLARGFACLLKCCLAFNLNKGNYFFRLWFPLQILRSYISFWQDIHVNCFFFRQCSTVFLKFISEHAWASLQRLLRKGKSSHSVVKHTPGRPARIYKSRQDEKAACLQTWRQGDLLH